MISRDLCRRFIRPVTGAALRGTALRGTALRGTALRDIVALGIVVLGGIVLTAAPAAAQAPGEDVRAFDLAGGSLSLEAPTGWKRVQPRSGIVETEFAVPPEAGDEQAGRMTVMGAGGGVQANVDRWYGQFTQPDGSATKDKASTKTLKISGCTVTIVDIAGTYKDSPGGPFAGGRTVDRPGYRMLAAIVEPEAKDKGSYFLKFYGPAKTVEKHADGFRKMVEGMVPAAK